MKWKDYIDEKAVRETLKTLKAEGELFEVRILGTDKKKIISGYFKSADSLLNAFDTIDVRSTNIYITLNAVNEACYSRVQHEKFWVTQQTTQDKEIDRYEWFFIDFDPNRPTGISSTDKELQASKEVMEKTKDYLKELGFEDPVVALSGNGYHLLYKIDCEVSQETSDLLRRSLEVLSNLFGNDDVKIDTVNYNPSRICKLHGTLAQKGADTEERPFRMSRILSGKKCKVNSLSALETLAEELPTMPAQKEKPTSLSEEFNLTDFMYRYGLDVSKVKEGNDCTIYELERCPFNPSHIDGDSKIFHYRNGAIAFKCHHDSCRGYKWQDVRLKYEPNAYDDTERDRDRAIEEGYRQHRKYQITKQTDNVEEVKKNIPKLNPISALDLQAKEFGKKYYAVENMIPTGETVIAAPPKTGKSWLMLDMCLQVAKGEKFLNFETKKSDTLYLALEDGDDFEQERLNIVLNGEKAPDNFHFIFENVIPLSSGFLLQLDDVLDKYPNIKLVVVDTLNFVKYRQAKGESAYECDYRTGSAIKQYAENHKIAIVVVTHTTKLIHIDDTMADVSGTNGTTGAADAVIVLSKKDRMDKDAKLFITGRKVKQTLHDVRFNDGSCKWEYIGVAKAENRDATEQREREKEYFDSDIRAAVIKIAIEEKHWKGRASSFIDRAVKYRMAVVESAMVVGGFFKKMQGLFMKDNIMVTIHDNGTGGKIYEIEDVNPFTDENDELNDDVFE